MDFLMNLYKIFKLIVENLISLRNIVISLYLLKLNKNTLKFAK